MSVTEPACSKRCGCAQLTTAVSAASERVHIRQVPGVAGGASTSTTSGPSFAAGSAAIVPSTGTVAPANVSNVATPNIVRAPTSTPSTIRRTGRGSGIRGWGIRGWDVRGWDTRDWEAPGST
ncbi:hypothetical protein BJF78_24280 [Pseudonocardia sp. CNS-139]|nr:hypothetical protein BJF78_24280 [Pseudonocardia sp. CNS-139]